MSSEAAAAVNLKQTPLHAEHVRRGAKMVDFGGWSMPVQYSGIIDEHQTVRTAVGAFDISHMGQFFVSGPHACSWLNRMLTNNVERLAVGQCQYTLLLNDRGGIIDDLIVYRIEEQRYLLVVNAAKIDEDFAWMQGHLSGDTHLENQSARYAGIAVQGPRAVELLDALVGGAQSRPSRNEILTTSIEGGTYFFARTGYTGEDGFEVFCPAEHAVKVWNDVLEKGTPLGIKPCGLGARDTLRLEMCYPLNGSDLSPDHTPLEAGLGFFVDMGKQTFIGHGALIAQRENGVPTRLVPFRMLGKTPPPRSHYPIVRDGQRIAETTSGGLSPSLNAGIGMAYLPTAIARAGEQIEIDIRGRLFPAEIEKKPLYRGAGATAPAPLVP